jgi:hypothetical protein
MWTYNSVAVQLVLSLVLYYYLIEKMTNKVQIQVKKVLYPFLNIRRLLVYF